jgi:hypothetical protein
VLRGIRTVRYSTYNGVAVQINPGATGTTYVAMHSQGGTTGVFAIRDPVAQTPHATWAIEDIHYLETDSYWPSWGIFGRPTAASDVHMNGMAFSVDNGRFYPAISELNDQGYFEPVTGNYGSVQVGGVPGTNGSWEGYSIGGEFVFMAEPGGTSCGIYNDVENEWMIQCYRNGVVELRYNGSIKFETQSGGTKTTGQHQVTGNIDLDGNLVGDGASTISGIETVTIDSTGDITKASHGNYLYHASTAYDNDQNGQITFGTGAASGGTTGDIHFQYS